MEFERGKSPIEAMEIGNEAFRELKTVRFFVEANTFETHALWEKYNRESSWLSEVASFTITIGEVDNRPIVVWFSINTICSKKVAFYHGCSEVVDHKMIRDFLDTNFPVMVGNSDRRALVDAQDFHNCINSLHLQ